MERGADTVDHNFQPVFKYQPFFIWFPIISPHRSACFTPIGFNNIILSKQQAKRLYLST
jgi:hypothetical protein